MHILWCAEGNKPGSRCSDTKFWSHIHGYHHTLTLSQCCESSPSVMTSSLWDQLPLIFPSSWFFLQCDQIEQVSISVLNKTHVWKHLSMKSKSTCKYRTHLHSRSHSSFHWSGCPRMMGVVCDGHDVTEDIAWNEIYIHGKRSQTHLKLSLTHARFI